MLFLMDLDRSLHPAVGTGLIVGVSSGFVRQAVNLLLLQCLSGFNPLRILAKLKIFTRHTGLAGSVQQSSSKHK